MAEKEKFYNDTMKLLKNKLENQISLLNILNNNIIDDFQNVLGFHFNIGELSLETREKLLRYQSLKKQFNSLNFQKDVEKDKPMDNLFMMIATFSIGGLPALVIFFLAGLLFYNALGNLFWILLVGIAIIIILISIYLYQRHKEKIEIIESNKRKLENNIDELFVELIKDIRYDVNRTYQQKISPIVKHIKIDMNILFDQIKREGLAIPYKCPNCSGNIKITGNTIETCPYCNSDIDYKTLSELVKILLS